MRILAKIWLVILGLSLFGNIFVFPAEAAGQAYFRLTSSKTTYYVGEKVYINIEVKTAGEPINVARVITNFTGGDVLLVNDFSIGTALPYKSPGFELNNETDYINVGAFILMDYVDKDFLMGTLIFTANQIGSSDIGKPFLSGSHIIDNLQQEQINLSACQGITINVIEPVTPNNPPIASSQTFNVKVGDSVSTVISAYDPDGDNLIFSWGVEYNAYFSNPTSGFSATLNFNYTATVVGDYIFPFTVSDDDPVDPKSVNRQIRVIVSEEPPPPANLAPIFQRVSNKNIELGQSVSFQVVAADPDGDNVDLSWDIPQGAIFINVNENRPTATGDFYWTPTQAGSYTVNFYAVDDHPFDPKSSTLTVIINVSVVQPPENRPPRFQNVPNMAINLGESINFVVRATDPDGDMVTLTWDIPLGAGFANVTSDVTASGNFSWTPAAEGVYTLVFNATDDHPINPLSSSLTISIAVSVPPPPPNNPPRFDPVGEKTLLAGETLQFNIRAYDPDGDNVTLSMEPMETAVWVVNNSGSDVNGNFSWTPQVYGIYYVLFKATDDHPANPLTSQLSVRITVFGGECPPCGGGECEICSCEQSEIVFSPEDIKYPAPIIHSPSHPNQSLWYSLNKTQFTWFVDQPNLGYYFNLDQNPYADPANAYFLRHDQFFSFSEVADGFWYFHLKVKYSDGWSETGHYLIKIDTTPPEFFKPSILENKALNNEIQYEIHFSALDKHSGVAYYQIKIGEGDWQLVQSPYVLRQTDRDAQFIYLKAVDNAGNYVQVAIDPEKLVVLEDLQEAPEDILARLGALEEQNILEYISATIYEKIFDNPQIAKITEDIITPSLLAFAAANILAAILPFLPAYLPYLHLFFTEPLLWFFRRKRKKWGIVYDSLTKMPLDFAIVRLYQKQNKNNGNGVKLIKTKITDSQGRYYLKVEESGIYYLTVEKPGYVFPSRILRSFKEDNKYIDLYKGEFIEVNSKNSVINVNIPLDQKDKKALPLKDYINLSLRRNLQKIFAYTGMILAAIILVIAPTWINFAAFFIHIALFSIFRILLIRRKPKGWGIVYDNDTKAPVGRVVVKIFDLKFNKLLDVGMTDYKGRYGFLVGSNRYRILIEKNGYQRQLISPVDLETKEQIIDLDVALRKINNNFVKK